MVDVLVFISILLVWVISYGVAVQALLFPFEEASWDLIIKIVEVPYWQIHGQIFLEQLSGTHSGHIYSAFVRRRHFLLLGESTDDCISHPFAHDVNSTSDYSICPQKEWLVVLLMAGYLVVTVIVLLNLLIAIFKCVP